MAKKKAPKRKPSERVIACPGGSNPPKPAHHQFVFLDLLPCKNGAVMADCYVCGLRCFGRASGYWITAGMSRDEARALAKSHGVAAANGRGMPL